jgi:hypothetical protein
LGGVNDGPAEKAGGAVNQTPYVMLLPDSEHVYTALWVRDSSMALGSDLIPNSELLGWIKLIAGAIPEAGPNVNVPPYSVPEHIYLNGASTFFPGEDTDGAAERGVPAMDNAFFFLFDVSEYARMTGEKNFLKESIKDESGMTSLAVLCRKVFEAVHTDQTTGLCVLDQPTFDFGFCDSVHKSGKVLFGSLLRYDAAQRLEPLYRALGDDKDADYFQGEARKIKANLIPTFYHDSTQNSGEGWLHAATQLCNQPDVWGSAYAIDLDLLDGSVLQKVGRSLVRGYKERSLVLAGCVSEVLQHDPANPHGWQSSDTAFGDYQNGPYWGTGSGWYLEALSKVDFSTARAMAKDYVNFLRANVRSDGATMAWEFFDPNLNKYVHPLYVATVALPYGTLKRANLIP